MESFMDVAEKGALEESISKAPDFGVAGTVLLL